MISRDAEVVSHDPPLKRIDIGGVPKSQATKAYEHLCNYLSFYGMTTPPGPEPYVSDSEAERIWKLIEQFSVTCGDTSETMERSEPKGQLAVHDQDRRCESNQDTGGMVEPERQAAVQHSEYQWTLD